MGIEIEVNVITGEITENEYTSEDFSSAPTLEQQKSNRASAYSLEADPLFFKAQRGEATMDEWLALVAEIKARFPYPSE